MKRPMAEETATRQAQEEKANTSQTEEESEANTRISRRRRIRR